MKKSPTPFEYRLLRRRTQKHIRIRIDRQGVVVVSAPHHLSDRAINKALKTKIDWVETHLNIHQKGKDYHNPLIRITWEGNEYKVKQGASRPRGRIKLEFQEDICIISNLPDHDEEIKISAALKKKARPLIEKRLKEASIRTGIPYKTFFLRNQKSLWGSSSGKGNISLNWRVAMLPPTLQEYLICHELAHQKHFNHSKIYWDELEKIFHGAREANKELKKWKTLMDLFRKE